MADIYIILIVKLCRKHIHGAFEHLYMYVTGWMGVRFHGFPVPLKPVARFFFTALSFSSDFAVEATIHFKSIENCVRSISYTATLMINRSNTIWHTYVVGLRIPGQEGIQIESSKNYQKDNEHIVVQQSAKNREISPIRAD